jgi:hypothetical protein
LVERAIEPEVTIGLGGTRVMWAGDTAFYGLSLVNATIATMSDNSILASGGPVRNKLYRFSHPNSIQ